MDHRRRSRHRSPGACPRRPSPSRRSRRTRIDAACRRGRPGAALAVEAILLVDRSEGPKRLSEAHLRQGHPERARDGGQAGRGSRWPLVCAGSCSTGVCACSAPRSGRAVASQDRSTADWVAGVWFRASAAARGSGRIRPPEGTRCQRPARLRPGRSVRRQPRSKILGLRRGCMPRLAQDRRSGRHAAGGSGAHSPRGSEGSPFRGIPVEPVGSR